MEPQNLDALNREAVQRWEQNAAFWDERFGDAGNDFHRTLVGPSAERLLALRPGEDVLEIACGNGVFTRRMAELGARVLATDVSEAFLQRARERSIDRAKNNEFRAVDATNEAQLLTLGREHFDAAVPTARPSWTLPRLIPSSPRCPRCSSREAASSLR